MADSWKDKDLMKVVLSDEIMEYVIAEYGFRYKVKSSWKCSGRVFVCYNLILLECLLEEMDVRCWGMNVSFLASYTGCNMERRLEAAAKHFKYGSVECHTKCDNELLVIVDVV
nr:hypothetical protein [Tanacetum cinerariifolium]